MDRVELKESVKQRVQGNRWNLLKANIVAGLIAYGVNMIISNIFPLLFGGTALITEDPTILFSSFITTYLITLIASTVISAPLQMGLIMYYNQFDKEDFADLNIIFKPFKYLIKIVVITIFVSVLIGFGIMIFIIPGILLALSFSNIPYILIAFGTLFFIIPGIILALSFSIIPYVYMKHPELGVMDMVSTAWRMMKGHKMDYFILELSFLGWMLLGVITCGLAYLWVTPYQQLTYVRFFNEIDEAYFAEAYAEEKEIHVDVKADKVETPNEMKEEKEIVVDVSDDFENNKEN